VSANFLKFLVSGLVILRSEKRDFDFVHETRGGRPTRTTVVKSITLAWSIIPFYKCLCMPVYLLAYLKNQIRKLRQPFMHAAWGSGSVLV